MSTTRQGNAAGAHQPDGASDPKLQSRGMTGRVVAVLDAVVNRPDGDTGVRELAARLDISRSSVHRILQTLGDLRIVRARPNGRYDPGARMMAWAKFIAERHVLLTNGHGALEKLVQDTQESALLLTYTPNDPHGLVVDSCESAKPIRYSVQTGSRSPLHAGSGGKAILAHLPDEVLVSLERPALTSSTIAEVDRLRRDLTEIRDRGYATSIGERIPEAAGAAAAYFRDGAVAGAVNLTIPRYRLGDGDLDRFGKLVRQVADQLTAALSEASQRSGGQPPVRPNVVGLAGSTEGGPAERRSVVRVATALDSLARCPQPGLSANTFAEQISSGRATASRLLGGLRDLGVAWDQGKDFYAGPEMLVWSAMLGHGRGIAPVAADVLAELVQDVDESAYLAVYDHAEECVVFEDGRLSDKPISYVIPLGSRAPLHAGAAGKAVLSHSGDSSFDAQNLHRFSPSTIIDPDALRKDLEEIRERGYAVSVGERIQEAAGIAAPFFSDGTIAGAITVTIPRHRFDPKLVSHYGSRAVAAARELTRLLSTAC